MRDLSPLFDTDSVRRYEKAAIAAVGDESLLMAQAGQAGWRRLLELWPAATRVLVVCGRGGNGGDGYVLARLAHVSGRDACVVELSRDGAAHAAASGARAAYAESGGRIAQWSGTLPDADILVDAVLGIGLVGEPRPDAAHVIAAINAHPAPVLALDVPSGVDAAGVPADAVRADATLEFLLPKAVLRTGRAREMAGELSCAVLDIPAHVPAPTPCARLADVGRLSTWLRARRRDSHKGENGRVACVGGEIGSGGAILLCAEAALRAGAGLVRVHTRDVHLPALLARVPEAMASPENDGVDPEWPDVVAIGPGLGQGNWGFAHLHRVIDAGAPLVVDADALNLVARHGLHVPPSSVLTPHPGEAARLLGCRVADVQRDRRSAAQRLADRYEAAVVLKGAGTIVAAPGEVPVVLDAGNPGMATAGMGDALTGVVAALRAQGLGAFEAAVAGALLHSAAGDIAAADGERGLMARDVLPHLQRLANPA